MRARPAWSGETLVRRAGTPVPGGRSRKARPRICGGRRDRVRGQARGPAVHDAVAVETGRSDLGEAGGRYAYARQRGAAAREPGGDGGGLLLQLGERPATDARELVGVAGEEVAGVAPERERGVLVGQGVLGAERGDEGPIGEVGGEVDQGGGADGGGHLAADAGGDVGRAEQRERAQVREQVQLAAGLRGEHAEDRARDLLVGEGEEQRRGVRSGLGLGEGVEHGLGGGDRQVQAQHALAAQAQRRRGVVRGREVGGAAAEDRQAQRSLGVAAGDGERLRGPDDAAGGVADAGREGDVEVVTEVAGDRQGGALERGRVAEGDVDREDAEVELGAAADRRAPDVEADAEREAQLAEPQVDGAPHPDLDVDVEVEGVPADQAVDAGVEAGRERAPAALDLEAAAAHGLARGHGEVAAALDHDGVAERPAEAEPLDLGVALGALEGGVVAADRDDGVALARPHLQGEAAGDLAVLVQEPAVVQGGLGVQRRLAAKRHAGLDRQVDLQELGDLHAGEREQTELEAVVEQDVEQGVAEDEAVGDELDAAGEPEGADLGRELGAKAGEVERGVALHGDEQRVVLELLGLPRAVERAVDAEAGGDAGDDEEGRAAEGHAQHAEHGERGDLVGGELGVGGDLDLVVGGERPELELIGLDRGLAEEAGVGPRQHAGEGDAGLVEGEAEAVEGRNPTCRARRACRAGWPRRGPAGRS
jgi:hypothetical protein